MLNRCRFLSSTLVPLPGWPCSVRRTGKTQTEYRPDRDR